MLSSPHASISKHQRKGEIMKAVRYHSYGDSDVLVYEEADRPVAGPGQVVLKVAAAAFNPLDVAIRAGFVRQEFPVAFPHGPNFDVAGGVSRACGRRSPRPRPRRACPRLPARSPWPTRRPCRRPP